jgi:D-alanyl-D-alanine carboxypeptidase (penicillin-binding protein 5/6)
MLGVALAAFVGVGTALGAPPNIGAPHAMVVEAETGSVLFEKAADDLIAPASLAKLMTVEVVFDQLALGNISLDDEFPISVNAWRNGGAPSHGSTMFAALKSKVSVENLLKGVMIQSANDGCIALAEGIAGNEAKFVRLMNDRAREIGLTKSYFTNVDGLPDPKMRVTPRELARLARHIVLNYPERYKWFGEREFTWNKIRQQNRNPLLGTVEGADGIKTGFTSEAGYNLVGSAVQGGVRLIVVLTGGKTAKERAEDAKRLLEWGFKSFEAKVLFAAGQPVARAKVYGGSEGHVAVAAKAPVRLMVPRGVSDKIVVKMVYTGPVRAPVRRGQEVGRLQVWRGEAKVLDVPVQAAEDIGTGSLTQRTLDAAAELVIGLFRDAVKRI